MLNHIAIYWYVYQVCILHYAGILHGQAINYHLNLKPCTQVYRIEGIRIYEITYIGETARMLKEKNGRPEVGNKKNMLIGILGAYEYVLQLYV